MYEREEDWEFAYYLKFIKDQFEHSLKYRLTKGQKLEFFAIEDSKNNCLGIVEVDNAKKDKQNLSINTDNINYISFIVGGGNDDDRNTAEY